MWFGNKINQACEGSLPLQEVLCWYRPDLRGEASGCVKLRGSGQRQRVHNFILDLM